jgi:hypothetical protein
MMETLQLLYTFTLAGPPFTLNTATTLLGMDLFVQVLKSLVEFYTILLEEHLQVALEMEVGICSSL